MPPPEDCRIPPKKRTFIEQFAKINKDSEKLDARQYLGRLATVVDPMLDAETDVAIMAARLRCMQEWASIIEKSSADFREVLYAPPETKVMKLIEGYFEK